LGSTPAIFLNTFPAADTSGKWAGDSVDVRDVAILLVDSLVAPEAGGERILATNGKWPNRVVKAEVRLTKPRGL
jgi:hypothetical protein